MPANPIRSFVQRVAGRLRFPYLFLLTAALFLIDVFVPDMIPFIDEILLGLGVVLMGSLRKKVADKQATSSSPPALGDEQKQT